MLICTYPAAIHNMHARSVYVYYFNNIIIWILRMYLVAMHARMGQSLSVCTIHRRYACAEHRARILPACKERIPFEGNYIGSWALREDKIEDPVQQEVFLNSQYQTWSIIQTFPLKKWTARIDVVLNLLVPSLNFNSQQQKIIQAQDRNFLALKS